MGLIRDRKWMAKTITKRKRWAFRLAAIAIGLLPMVLAEAILAGLGLPSTPAANDPLVDLHQLKPLFAPALDDATLAIPSSRYDHFRPESIEREKPANQFRIFALGGSTVQGSPFTTETSFSTWLQLSLAAASNEHQWRVINCGGTSYASYRVAAILDEVIEYEPDLLIFFLGHNEFLEDRTYGNWKKWPRSSARVVESLASLRTVQLLRQLAAPLAKSSSVDPLPWVAESEVNARLDKYGGLEPYVRDQKWRNDIIEHFRITYTRMLRRAHDYGIPVIVCVPVSDLRDTPPFKVVIEPHASLEDQEKMKTLWQRIQLSSNSASERMQSCRELLECDPHHSGAAYVLGRLMLDQQKFSEAKYWLTVARDWDVCPLRATSEIETIVREAAGDLDAPLLDVLEKCESLSRHGIVGAPLLVDHVHPSVEVHQRIGRWLAEIMIEEGHLVAEDDWEERARTAYTAHLSTLGEYYFIRGRQRLEGLRKWTEGRAGEMSVE